MNENGLLKNGMTQRNLDIMKYEIVSNMKTNIITLVFLIFSFVTTVTIADAYYAGYGTLIDTPSSYESDILQYRQTIINGTSVAIDDEGNIFFGSGRNLYKSSDGGNTHTLLYTFPDIIQSIYYYNYTNVLFVGGNDSNIYRSIDRGTTWDSVLTMSIGYPLWWSWDSDSSKILVGRYGNTPKANNSIVYESVDSGQTWKMFFSANNYYNITDTGAHTHLVKIDPYNNNRVFINVGDNPYYRGLYVTEDNGLHFDQTPSVQYGNGENTANGFLAAVFPDKDAVLFFTDNTPTVWGYNKNNKEARKLAEFPDPYYAEQVKFYDAVQGHDGVIYVATVDYIGNLSYIWIGIDGTTWYRLNSNFQDTSAGNRPLRYNPKDGYIYAGTASYGKGIAFKDITKDQAKTLLDSVNTSPKNGINVAVREKNIVNYISNPSFENGNPPTGWNISDMSNGVLSKDCTTSRYDSCSIKISNSTLAPRTTYKYISNTASFNLTGNTTYVVRFSYKLDKSIGNNRGPLLDVIYNNRSAHSLEKVFMSNQYANSWSDVVYYWTPSEDIIVTKVFLYMYDQLPTYWFDGISIYEDRVSNITDDMTKYDINNIQIEQGQSYSANNRWNIIIAIIVTVIIGVIVHMLAKFKKS